MSANQTILLVDDSEDDLLLLRLAFRKAEFDNPLQTARNGQEAIAYLKGEGIYGERNQYPLPGAMLLDLNMPMSSGFDVLGWIGAEPAVKALSAIVFTASMRPEDVARAFALGASAYLVKPSNLDGLTAMIRSLRDWLQINHFPPGNSMPRG